MKNLAIIEVVAETSNLSAPELIKAATKVHTAGDSVAIAPLRRGAFVGIREASKLPIPKKKKTSTIATSATAKSATPSAATKAHKPVFVDGAEHYNYGNWIYVTVK